MRASRLISMLMTLQTRGRVTAKALADELEISVRTVYRDIDQLSAAGVPVYADRGPNGGFQLLDGYRTKLTGLTMAEAETLFLTGVPAAADELGLGGVMAAAQRKLLAALPAGWSDRAERLGARFHLDPLGWYHGPEANAFLPEIARAVWDTLRIRVSYESWKGVVTRELQPLGLALKAGIWYLVAYAEKSPRTYRISNILKLAVTVETFVRPKDFDLAKFWGTAAAEFESGRFRGTASLLISQLGMKLLSGLDSGVGEAAAASAGDPDKRGWRLVSVPIETLDHACHQFLKLGPEAEVLKPAELRARMAAESAKLAAIYKR
jgi:predicted DNA-binding transcriptional regulator YafY